MIEEDYISRQVSVRKKVCPSRVSSLKYSKSDMDALLDCECSMKPLCSNHWAEITDIFEYGMWKVVDTV